MAALILYKSIWGSTKQYSDWIAKEVLDGKSVSIDDYDFSDFDNYDKVVIGSRVYMSKIEALTFLERNWDKISTKPVYLFMVGLVPMDHPDSIKSLELIPENIRMHLTGFIKLPGRIEFKKLNFFQRTLVRMMGFGEVDKVDISHIAPIVDWVAS